MRAKLKRHLHVTMEQSSCKRNLKQHLLIHMITKARQQRVHLIQLSKHNYLVWRVKRIKGKGVTETKETNNFS